MYIMDQTEIIYELQEICEKYCKCKITAEDIHKVLSFSKIQKYQKNEIIHGMFEKMLHTGIVLDGIVRSYYLDIDGNEITKLFCRKGFLVMDEGLLGYENSTCAFEALKDATILLMDTAQLKKLIKTNDTFKEIYITSLEGALRYKIYREKEFLVKNATQRYLQFCEDFPELKDCVKQSHISTYLGITPESLSRIRKSLKK